MSAYKNYYENFPMITEIDPDTIVDIFSQNDRNVAFITPFKGDLSRVENIKNIKTLNSRLRKQMGVVYSDTSWVNENIGKKNNSILQEALLIFSGNTMSFNDFVYLLQSSLTKYKQDTFLAYDKHKSLTKIIKDGNEVVSFADFSLDKAQEALSNHLKNGYEGRLKFERFRHSLSWVARMGLRSVDQSNVIL